MLLKYFAEGCFHTRNSLWLPEEHQWMVPALEEICLHYSHLWNHTAMDSEVWRINHAGGRAVSVSQETFELLQFCETQREAADGCFDLLACTAKHRLQMGKSVPLSIAGQIELLSGNRVRIPDGTSVDFGGVAKGFVCDRLAEYLYQQRVKHALINLGGNVYALGNHPSGEPWVIGIRNPEGSSKNILGAVRLTDASAVTSGMYERNLVVAGKVLHHIINPATGLPCETDLTSVTVIDRSSTKCDVLSTAITVMGFERGCRFAASNRIDCILVSRNGQVAHSPSLDFIYGLEPTDY